MGSKSTKYLLKRDLEHKDKVRNQKPFPTQLVLDWIVFLAMLLMIVRFASLIRHEFLFNFG